jgi:antitoxin VapB
MQVTRCQAGGQLSDVAHKPRTAALDKRKRLAYPRGGAMTRTKLFQSNRSQALRLPKDVAFPPDVREVTILRDGNRRIVVPANAIWEEFFASAGIDLGERDQPGHQERDAL